MKSAKLLEKASTQELTPKDCSLEIWMQEVAQKQRLGTAYGRDINLSIPERVLQPGSLRKSLINEFSFKAISEDYATRGICHLAASATDNEEHEFLMTQVFDEALHALAFKHHLEEIEVADSDIEAFIQQKYSREIKTIFTPLNDFFQEVAIDNQNYLGGITILTIILEGVLAPTAELGEIKWQRLNPVASDIQHQANLDEVRHLTICANILKTAIEKDYQAIHQILPVLEQGMKLWQEIPIQEVVYEREVLFQEGMLEHRDVVGDQRLLDYLRLIDSTPEQRMQIAFEWTHQMQTSRINYIGLEKLSAIA